MSSTMQQKINDFFGEFPIKHYKKGQTIIESGFPPSHIFYVIDGVIDQLDIATTGSKVVVHTFRKGSFFPMSLFMNNTPNEYFYEASTPTTVRLADPQQTLAFVTANPDILTDLLARVYRGTDVLLKRIALTNESAARRLMFEILVEWHRFGEQDAHQNVLPINQQTLASRTGLARETVSRELQKLMSDGIITKSKGGIILHDIDALIERVG